MAAILCSTWSKLSRGDTQLHRNILNKRLWCKPHSQFGRQPNMRSIGLDSRPARHRALKMAWCSGENYQTSHLFRGGRLMMWTGQQSVRVQRSILPSWEGACWHPKATAAFLGVAGSRLLCPRRRCQLLLPVAHLLVYVLFCYLPQRPRAEGKANLDTKIKYSPRPDSLLCTCKQPLECHSIVDGLKTLNAAVTFP